MEALERDLKGLIHRQKCATSEAEVRAERIRQLLGNIDVSVDVHQRSGSWAVVSLQGGKKRKINIRGVLIELLGFHV